MKGDRWKSGFPCVILERAVVGRIVRFHISATVMGCDQGGEGVGYAEERKNL
jgi:hypothetical protein